MQMLANENSSPKKAPGKYLIVKNKISAKYVLMRKPAYCICENKGTDQPAGLHNAGLLLTSYIQNSKPL